MNATELREYKIWSGEWRPQGTPERPYAHTEEYILIPQDDGLPPGVVGTATYRRSRGETEGRAYWEIILNIANQAALQAAGVSLYQPMR